MCTNWPTTAAAASSMSSNAEPLSQPYTGQPTRYANSTTSSGHLGVVIPATKSSLRFVKITSSKGGGMDKQTPKNDPDRPHAYPPEDRP